MARSGHEARKRSVILGFGLLAWLIAVPAAAQTVVNQHVSSAGVQADGAVDENGPPSVSDDGRYVAFASYASNLVPGDTNAQVDIFVHDNLTGATVLISQAVGGGPANDSSVRPWISGNGRYVAFQSSATNLVTGDTNGLPDVFRYDADPDADGILHEPGETVTIRVSVTAGGAQSSGPSRSYPHSISDAGDVIAFESDATDLVAGDTNGSTDCFVRVVSTGTTVRVSVSTALVQGNGSTGYPAVSGNGLVVAFHSGTGPDNLVAGDTNAAGDVFVRDLSTGITSRVSVSSGGAQASGWSIRPAISDDGLLVSFESGAADLVVSDTNAGSDVFVHDRTSGTTTRVSVATGGVEAGGGSYESRISGNGEIVAFTSPAADLVEVDTNGAPDVFVHNRTTGVTARASRAVDGSQGLAGSSSPGVSADGSYVAFYSFATNLAPPDANGFVDVFLRGDPFLPPEATGGPPPAWTAVILHPAGGASSWAYTTNVAEQAGFTNFGLGAHAGTWAGTPASWTDLNPAGALDSSRVFAMAGTQQVGYATFPAVGMHAGVWSGTAASWADLNPPAALASAAHATTGTEQAGYADFGAGFHAGWWSGTPGSWVDMHPAVAAASYAWGMAPGQQVGGAAGVAGSFMHASLWTGTAASWVDLNPVGAAYSFCYSTTGTQQAGYAEVSGAEHAGIWSGTAASWLDLNPPGALSSRALSTTGTVQAGHADFGAGFNAGTWTGTPGSWENLHALLPAIYTSSESRWISASGGILAVVGFAFNSSLGRDEAVLWTSSIGPPPGSGSEGPVTFSVNGPVDPHTEGIRYARGTPATPQIPAQPGNPLGFGIRAPAVPVATGLPTALPGDVFDYGPPPSEAVMFQSPPLAPAAPGPPPTPPDGTNNQILEAMAMGLVAGPAVAAPLWMTATPARDNIDAFSFGEDYFPPMMTLGLSTEYPMLPDPPMLPGGYVAPGFDAWAARDELYKEPIVVGDAPGISFRFSVDPWAIGLAGTAVATESGGADAGTGLGPWSSPGEAAGDVFTTPLLTRVGGVTIGGGTNTLVNDDATMALAGPLDPFEDDLDALEMVGDNTLPWTPGGTPLRPGNLHARVAHVGPPDLPAPGASDHEPINAAPVFFSVTRSSTGAPFSAVRTKFVLGDGSAGNIYVAVKDPADPLGEGLALDFIDEAEVGLWGTDDLDALILWVCPEFRATVLTAIDEILGGPPYYTMGGAAPWTPLGTDAYTGGGMTVSITKYLAGTGRYIPPGCIRVGFSVTTDSQGLLYSGVDWEAGPVAPPGGVSSASGHLFYAEITGAAANSNYTWHGPTGLGLAAGSWINGVSTDLADLADNLNALDSAPGPPDTTTTAVPEPRDRERSLLRLDPNFPNPFSPRTTIAYTLARQGHVRLTIHDLRGRTVATLVDKVRGEGSHRVVWDGRDDRGAPLPAGVYFARVESGSTVRSLKLVMLR